MLGVLGVLGVLGAALQWFTRLPSVWNCRSDVPFGHRLGSEG